MDSLRLHLLPDNDPLRLERAVGSTRRFLHKFYSSLLPDVPISDEHHKHVDLAVELHRPHPKCERVERAAAVGDGCGSGWFRLHVTCNGGTTVLEMGHIQRGAGLIAAPAEGINDELQKACQ